MALKRKLELADRAQLSGDQVVGAEVWRAGLSHQSKETAGGQKFLALEWTAEWENEMALKIEIGSDSEARVSFEWIEPVEQGQANKIGKDRFFEDS